MKAGRMGAAPEGLWERGTLAFVPQTAEMRRLFRRDPRRFLCDWGRGGSAVIRVIYRAGEQSRLL